MQFSQSANMINYVHIEDYLPNDYHGIQKLEDGLGDLLAFFWGMAVKNRFPNNIVNIECDGDVINILNVSKTHNQSLKSDAKTRAL